MCEFFRWLHLIRSVTVRVCVWRADPSEARKLEAVRFIYLTFFKIIIFMCAAKTRKDSGEIKVRDFILFQCTTASSNSSLLILFGLRVAVKSA